MEIIILILTIIIIILIIYLFFIKKDLKRIKTSLKKVSGSDSNSLIHSELSLNEITDLINEINILLTENRSQKIDFERKNRILKKMIMNISHDLRTPLTSALGYIDIILNSNNIKSEQIHDLKIIEERLLRLEELIDSFFEFSKLTMLKENNELTKINIISVLESSIARYYEDFTNINREIIFNNNVKKINVEANEDLLSRVFDNLISNAYKHSGGNLEVKVTKEEFVKIVFINELDDQNLDIEHIFDEFYTKDISRTKGNTGLGLAIAKEFVESMNGNIYAEKNKNKLNIIIELIDKK